MSNNNSILNIVNMINSEVLFNDSYYLSLSPHRSILKEADSGLESSDNLGMCSIIQDFDSLPTAVTRCNSLNTSTWEVEGEKVLYIILIEDL